MSASETALPLRVGARTLVTLRRRLVRRRLSLEEALTGQAPRLPTLGRNEHGYLVNALPAGLAQPLACAQGDLKPFVRQAYVRSYARLDLGFDSYFSAFSAKSRSTLRRKVKKLADRSGGSLDLRAYRNEAEIETFHRAARSVSALTYQERRLGAGLPDGPEALASMQALARQGLARGWLLFVDGRPISYLYAPAEGSTLIYAYLGYDPEFAAFSPGTVLQLEAMRTLMDEGDFRLFDFTEGEGQHKRQFATGGLDCVDLLLVRPTPANLAIGHTLNAFDAAVAMGKKAATTLGAQDLLRRLRR
ncbi:GNAT family N-acetyltransferase [Sphingosinicella sp. CPCC 101087]|uniref:GNAT family N-acetyltransferase n=1 Tax=Sphingosinicella sp. CPCC 101087 TaxID=2497754 RepID=UPI00101C646A|nr:GNAT family N-acetyltransferase [Sphingosinicella sp. CPCC 101087]